MITKVIENRIVSINVGSAIELDSGRCEKLLVCDDWDKAEFRFPNPIHEWREVHAIACNVAITGRTFQKRAYGSYGVRVQITWVGDDEPDHQTNGWLVVDPWYCERTNK